MLKDEIARFLQNDSENGQGNGGNGSGIGNGSGKGYGWGIGNGYGYGNGDGNGNGYGNGSGNGYGNGIGSGYGNGIGSGNGNGSGNGYGNGIGSGYGNGIGSGYGNGIGSGKGWGIGNGYRSGWGKGYGWGNGRGIQSFCGMEVFNIDDIPTIITQVRGNVAKGYILYRNVYKKPCFVVKGSGLFAHGDTLREAMEALEEKRFAKMDTESRVKEFCAAFAEGGLDKKYPAQTFFEWHNRLTGSCEAGRMQFVTNRGVNLQKDEFSVREFIEMTKDSYRGDVIRQAAEKLGM